MGSYEVVSLPGDGIGPEVTASAVEVAQAAMAAHGGVSLEITEHDASAERWKRTGVALPDETLEAAHAADAILMGAVGLVDARHPDGREVNGDVILRLRFELDLYAGIRPIRSFPTVPTPLRSDEPIDYVIVRENVEGLLASSVTTIRDEVAVDQLTVTRAGTQRVVEAAFRLAERRAGRRRVASVDKSNAVGAYAFFRKVFDEVAATHPGVTPDHVYVDAMTAFQVLTPQRFDVVVTENMFGDIISDLGGATVGGLRPSTRSSAPSWTRPSQTSTWPGWPPRSSRRWPPGPAWSTPPPRSSARRSTGSWTASSATPRRPPSRPSWRS